MSYFVGLTGGIGSGKSTVASIFAELGVPIVDTDVISHHLTQPGGLAISSIRNEFGNEFVDANGALNRSKMRQLVFSESSAKQRLEKILHPLIRSQAKTQAESITAPYILVVIPLLFESSGYQDWINHSVTVDCSPETQLDRASKRIGLNEQTVRAIMTQQLSRTQRLNLADDAISNDGSLAELRTQIEALNQHYLSLAKGSN